MTDLGSASAQTGPTPSVKTPACSEMWVVEPYECDCEGPWMIDGFVYRIDSPFLSRRPRWPYTTRHRIWHRPENDTTLQAGALTTPEPRSAAEAAK